MGRDTLKILYYANIHIKPNDGPSAHVLSVCRELGRRGHSVLLFTYPFDRSLHSDDFETLQIPDWPGRYENYYSYKRLFWRLCGYLAAFFFKPDVIYQRDRMDDMFPLSLSRKMDKPLVVEMNGWLPRDYVLHFDPDGYQKAVDAIDERYRHASMIISTTGGARDAAIKTFNFPADKVIYIRNGVDVTRFFPPRPYVRNPSRKFVLGYVFGYHPDLDVDAILSAMALLGDGSPFELHFVTYSPNIERWQERIVELGIASKVRFFCDIPQSEIPHLLWQMDVCLAVFTRSYVNTYNGVEGAMKLWEYWASQRPVIATDLPGTESYHHHLENCYLAVEPENPQALVQAIVKLYHSPKLAEELAHNGYKYVQHGHTWADTAREIEVVLQKAIERQ